MARNSFYAVFHGIWYMVYGILDGRAHLEGISLGILLGSVRFAVRRHGSCGSENGHVVGRMGSVPLFLKIGGLQIIRYLF